MSTSVTRRGFLAGLGTAVLAACSSKKPRAGFLGTMDRWNGKVQGGLYSPGRELTGFSDGKLTKDVRFPAYHVAPVMPVVPAGWKLVIGGMVERPGSFTLDDLMAMPRTDTRIEHHCVEGWSAVADWHGVRLSDLAERVGADRRARFIQFKSFDADENGVAYSSSWDRESAFHKQTLLAYGMNGKPLGIEHGAPVRLYGAVKLGYKQVKYLTEVRFVDEMTGGYWEDLGYEWYAGT